ncbi:hypothetical protein ONZ45_g9912 [Pleurotus djamor]|nr:hypothetical protein ONZ45_g9912 [Pleurotus djamor]
MPTSLTIYSILAHYISPIIIGSNNVNVPVGTLCPRTQDHLIYLLSLSPSLYGIMLGQSIWYFRRCKTDPVIIQALIMLVLLFEGIQTIALVQSNLKGYLHTPLDLRIPTGLFIDVYFSASTLPILASTHIDKHFSALIVGYSATMRWFTAYGYVSDLPFPSDSHSTYTRYIVSGKQRYVAKFLCLLAVIRFCASIGKDQADFPVALWFNSLPSCVGLNTTVAHGKTALKLHTTVSNVCMNLVCPLDEVEDDLLLSQVFGVVEMASAALCDILIATVMAIYLTKERSEFIW